MTSDVIVLKLVQPFNVGKYFNIFFGVIYKQRIKWGASDRVFTA